MDYLVHHGIKGQKWGVRRYQNEDGSYTEAGKKRRGIGKKVAIGVGIAAAGTGAAAAGARHAVEKAYLRARGITNTNTYDKPEFDRKTNAQNAAALNKGRESMSTIRQARKEQKRADALQQALDEARNMTDEQLKSRTARLNLENNYVNAISQQQINNGSDTIDKILASVGTALGIAATAVTIYGLVHK